MRRMSVWGIGLAVLLIATQLHGQAFSVPISDKVIQVSLVMPNGKIAKASVRDGTMLTVRDDDGGHGYVYGFVLSIEKNNQPSLRALHIDDLANGRQEVRQIGLTKEFLGSSLDATTPHGRFEFEVESIETWPFPQIRPLDSSKPKPRPIELEKLFGKSGGGTCCVTCGSTTVCGTAVDLDCGSCDSGGGRSPRVY